MENSANYISAALHKFEENKKQLILTEDLFGWNTWQLLKKPVFYAISNRMFNVKNKNTNTSLLTRVLAALILLFQILKLGIIRRGALLAFTSINYKLSTDSKGRFIDNFFDLFLKNVYKGNYIYVEANKRRVYDKKPLIEKDLKSEDFSFFIYLISFFIAKNKIRLTASKFEKEINYFFAQEGHSFKITKEEIYEMLSRFRASYIFHKILYYILSPKAVFIVDGIPTAPTAAAKKMQIPVFEFQHGFIIKDKPDYIMAEYLRELKYKMVVPNHLLMFGDFFKESILKSGFWSDDQVFSLGNYRINQFRLENKSSLDILSDFSVIHVLLATQIPFFEHTKHFLQNLVKAQPTKCFITIKCHLREPEANLNWYREFANENSTLIKFVDPKISLVSLMASHHITVSFLSTAVFEALALGLPVITLGTSQFPLGINSVIDVDITDVLKSVVDAEEFKRITQRFKQDQAFRDEWLEACQEKKTYFYSSDYLKQLDWLNERVESY